MYSLLRRPLFLLKPEAAHDLTLDLLGAAHRLGLLGLLKPTVGTDPVEVLGLRFDNPVGLAAGLDKNADYFEALGQLGFGFVEVGTVTPKPQPGNSQPRLFRLSDYDAIINRMGFNNKGVEHLVQRVKEQRVKEQRVKERRYSGVLGINIGKNKLTLEEDALSDYQSAMTAVYPYADYITVNISSPNTPGLRDLQFGDNLKRLLVGLKETQQHLSAQHSCYKPILVKIAPDMDELAIKSLSEEFVAHNIDGVIATNTTLDHSAVRASDCYGEAGGLSGGPLTEKSTQVIEQLRSHLGQMPIIGVGGILQGSDAVAKIKAGANLVQLYSGLIYRGPALVKEVRQAILEAR